MKKIILTVKGMHCKSCEMIIKDVLSDAGASKVDASEKKGIVTVEFEESKLNETQIKKLISDEGYKVA